MKKNLFQFLIVQKAIEMLSALSGKFMLVALLALASYGSSQLNAMEPKEYGSAKVSRKQLKKIQNEKLRFKSDKRPILDLHGLFAPQAKKQVIGFIKEQHNNFKTECRIITGRGNHVNANGSSGVLKEALPIWAQSTALKNYIKSIDLDNNNDGMYNIKLTEAMPVYLILTNKIFVEDNDIKTSDIDLSLYEIECVSKDIHFYEEYKPQKEKNNQISFPMNKCYPVALENTGNTKWFFSSAIKASNLQRGKPITITDTSITDVFVVRGETKDDHSIQVYFGINIRKPKFFNKSHAVYQGKILYLLTQSTKDIDNISDYCLNNAQHLNHMTIASEVSHYLSDTKDWDWNSPVFQKVIKDLFLKKDGSSISDKYLLSSVCYWDKEGNKLKEIKQEKK